MQTQARGRIIFSAEKAREFRNILRDLLDEYKKLPAVTEITESELLRRQAALITRGGAHLRAINVVLHL